MSVATPWLNFTTAISEGSGILCSGIGVSTGWQNPSNALAVGGGEASAQLTAAISESVYLRVTGLQGAVDALPENAIIEGIEVRVSRRFTRSGGTAVVRDCRAQIIKNGTLGLQNKAKTEDWPLNVLADAIYGGETDKWGWETWSRADLVSASFGFALRARRTDLELTHNALVDHVQARIYYTLPSEMFLVF